ncbi:universal stress protein [Roseibium sp.]|uniref:universal stress protein n=1 Tax=Roseibium sp. TaxID=1936156 RepID=UPI003A970122
MAFKTILAVAEYSKDVKAAIKAVSGLARAADAHLSVLLVGEAPSLPFYGYGGAGYTRVWIEESEERAEGLKAARDDVEAMLSAEGVSFDVRAHQAIVAREDNLVARHAIYADLTVILRSGEGDLTSVEQQAIDGAVFDSGRPVLYMPRPFAGREIGRRVLVAWNSRAEAAEAVSDAMPFLTAAEKVTLLTVDPVSGPEDHGEQPGADMALVLARHGINVEARTAQSDGRLVSEVILDEAKALDADLVVMGAYGHSRVRETILGGTTSEMLENSKLPLFLAH